METGDEVARSSFTNLRSDAGNVADKLRRSYRAVVHGTYRAARQSVRAGHFGIAAEIPFTTDQVRVPGLLALA